MVQLESCDPKALQAGQTVGLSIDPSPSGLRKGEYAPANLLADLLPDLA